MDLATVIDALKDPERRQDTLRKLSDIVTVIEDENGQQFKVVHLEDIAVPLYVLNAENQGGDRAIKNMKLKDDDIVLLTYPKTGSHWTYNLIRFVTKDGQLDEELSATPVSLENMKAELDSLPSPRLVFSHMSPNMLPKDTFKKGRKILLTYRNPKDAALSMFLHGTRGHILGEPFKISWNSFINSWMKGVLPFYDYFCYYNIWQKYIEDNRDVKIHVINFEALKSDGLTELRKIQRYLGLRHSDKRLQEILDRCSLQKLKADVDNKLIATLLVTDSGESFCYRKGIVGDWKNYFTVAQSEQMDALVAEKFENSIFKPKYF